MKATKFITGLFLCGSILAACDSDDDHGKETLISKPAKVTISIVNPSTYAPTGVEDGVGDENKVSSIEIYVFNPDGSIDTKTGVTETDPEEPGNGYLAATNIPSNSNLSFTVIMDSGNGKKLVAVANMELGPLDPGEDYDDLKAKISTGAFTASTADGYNSRTIPTGGFEMSGETVADIESGTANSVRIPISRLVSKINAPEFIYTDQTGEHLTSVNLTDQQKIDLWGEDAVDVGNITLRPIGYALVNGISKSSVLFNGRDDNDDTDPKENKPWVNWTTWNEKEPYLNSSFDATHKYTSAYSGPSTSNDWFLDGSTTGEECVYVYENKPKTITVNDQVGFDPLSVYAFIIKGELEVENHSNLNKERYWRVNLVWNDNYHIMRNSSYHVRINHIVTIGFDNEQEAEEDPDVITGGTSAEIQLVVNKWRRNQTETDM